MKKKVLQRSFAHDALEPPMCTASASNTNVIMAPVHEDAVIKRLQKTLAARGAGKRGPDRLARARDEI
jgi:hypothetical protein